MTLKRRICLRVQKPERRLYKTFTRLAVGVLLQGWQCRAIHALALSDTAQCPLHTLVRQRIGPLIAGVAVMAPDPAPVDGVAAGHQ